MMNDEIKETISQNKKLIIKQTHHLGLISFILSIIGLFISFLFPFALQIIGIILGHVSKSDVNANPERYHNTGLITVGLFINYLVIILSLLFILVFGAGIAYLLSIFNQ